MLFDRKKTDPVVKKTVVESSAPDTNLVHAAAPELANETNQSGNKIVLTNAGSNPENAANQTTNMLQLSQNSGEIQLPATTEVSPNSEKIAEMNEKEVRFLAQLFKYGCLRTPAVVLGEYLMSILDIVQVRDEKICFHTPKSLEVYADHCHIRTTEVRRKAIRKTAVPVSDIPLILAQNDLLLALEQTNKYQLWDWLSVHNPRRKKSLKIQKGGKRGCLTPHLVVILRSKGDKYGLVFDTVSSAYEAFLPGERSVYYREILLAYHNWLSSENLEIWLKKRHLYVAPTHVGVAILLDENQDHLLDDLLDLCQNQDIKTPIYFTDKQSFTAKPFAWYSRVDPEKYPLFLNVRNKK